MNWWAKIGNYFLILLAGGPIDNIFKTNLLQIHYECFTRVTFSNHIVWKQMLYIISTKIYLNEDTVIEQKKNS